MDSIALTQRLTQHDNCFGSTIGWSNAKLERQRRGPPGVEDDHDRDAGRPFGVQRTWFGITCMGHQPDTVALLLSDELMAVWASLLGKE